MRSIILFLLLGIAPFSLYAKNGKIRHTNDTASYARGRQAIVFSGFPSFRAFHYVNEGTASMTLMPMYSYMILKRTELRAGAYTYMSNNERHGARWTSWRYAADLQLRYYTPNTKWFIGAEYMLGRWHLRSTEHTEAMDNSNVWINNISAMYGYSRTVRKNAGKYNGLISWELSNSVALAQFGYAKSSMYAYLIAKQFYITVKYHIPTKKVK